jgi:hypothetical protein
MLWTHPRLVLQKGTTWSWTRVTRSCRGHEQAHPRGFGRTRDLRGRGHLRHRPYAPIANWRQRTFMARPLARPRVHCTDTSRDNACRLCGEDALAGLTPARVGRRRAQQRQGTSARLMARRPGCPTAPGGPTPQSRVLRSGAIPGLASGPHEAVRSPAAGQPGGAATAEGAPGPWRRRHRLPLTSYQRVPCAHVTYAVAMQGRKPAERIRAFLLQTSVLDRLTGRGG